MGPFNLCCCNRLHCSALGCVPLPFHLQSGNCTAVGAFLEATYARSTAARSQKRGHHQVHSFLPPLISLISRPCAPLAPLHKSCVCGIFALIVAIWATGQTQVPWVDSLFVFFRTRRGRRATGPHLNPNRSLLILARLGWGCWAGQAGRDRPVDTQMARFEKPQQSTQDCC